MLKHINDNLHHYANHLVTVSMVLFLLVVNLFVFNYASASEGSPADVEVSNSIDSVVVTYRQAEKSLYNYSIVFGNLLLAWEDFDLAESYQLALGK